MGDKAEVASFGNCSLRAPTLSTSAVARRRSAVVDRLRRRIDLFRGRSSTNPLPVQTSSALKRHADDGQDFVSGSNRQLSVQHFNLADEQKAFEEYRHNRAFTGMMTDGGCWTAIAPPDQVPMIEPGVGGRWAMRDGGPRITAAVPGVDVRQWQSAEVMSSSTASSRMLHNGLIGHHLSPTVPCVAPHQPSSQQQHQHHHHQQQQQQQQYQGCSMAQTPRYDGTGGQSGGSAMPSPRVDDATASASGGGGATVSVSIVHNLDATGLYNQAKGEIKLTFSSTLSAPVAAPNPTGVDPANSCPASSSSVSDPSSTVAAGVVAAAMDSAPRPSACWTMPTATSTTAVTRTASSMNSGHKVSVSSTSSSSSSSSTTNVGDHHTLSDADDIISEFLGQINGSFVTSSGGVPNDPSDHRLYSQSNVGHHLGRHPSSLSSESTLRHVTVTSDSHGDARLFSNPLGQSATHPSASGAYGLPPYQHRRKEPEINGGVGPQRQIGVPYKPTSGYAGYAAMPEYNLTTGAIGTGGSGSGSGRDIATGPAAETLKKMAAMHRSLYEKAPSPSSGDLSWYPASVVDPYNNYPSTGFDYRNAAEQFTEYNKTPLYRQHQYLPTHNTGSTIGGPSIDPATYGYSQALPLHPNSTSSVRALPPYNSAPFGGAMKPLSHFPDVGGATRMKTSSGTRITNGTSLGSTSSRPKNQTQQLSPDRFVRLSQTQQVTIHQQQQQQQAGASDAHHNGNAFRIDAAQTQHVHVRVAVGQSTTLTGQQAYGGTGVSESPRPADPSYCRPNNSSSSSSASSWRTDMGQPLQPPYDRYMSQSNGSTCTTNDVRWFRQTPSYTTATAANSTTVNRGHYDGIDGYRQSTTAPPAYRRESEPSLGTTTIDGHHEHLGPNHGGYQFHQPGAAGQYAFQAEQKQSISFVVGGGAQQGPHPSMPSEYGVPSSQCSSLTPRIGADQFQHHYRQQQQQQHLQQQRQKQGEDAQTWNSLPAPTQSLKNRTPLVGSTIGCSMEPNVVQSTYDVADFDDVVDMAAADGPNFAPDGCFSRAASVGGATTGGNSNDLNFIDEIFGR